MRIIVTTIKSLLVVTLTGPEKKDRTEEDQYLD